MHYFLYRIENDFDRRRKMHYFDIKCAVNAGLRPVSF